MDDAIRKLAVDTIYNSRENNLVMDIAAEVVAEAILTRVADELEEKSAEQENKQRKLAYHNAALHCKELTR